MNILLRSCKRVFFSFTYPQIKFIEELCRCILATCADPCPAIHLFKPKDFMSLIELFVEEPLERVRAGAIFRHSGLAMVSWSIVVWISYFTRDWLCCKRNGPNRRENSPIRPRSLTLLLRQLANCILFGRLEISRSSDLPYS